MKKAVLLGIVFVFLMSNLAFARGGFDKGGFGLMKGKFWQMPDIVKKLNITDDEKSKLDALYFENKSKLIEQKSDIQKNRLELEQLMSNEPLDETAVKKQFEKVQEIRNQLATERFNFLLEVRKILGKERFEQLKGMAKEKRMNRQGGRRGQRGQGGQGMGQPSKSGTQ